MASNKMLQAERDRLAHENMGLRKEIDTIRKEHDRIRDLYTKLSDAWNAYQGSSIPPRPDLTARMEAKGEFARKLTVKLIRWVEQEYDPINTAPDLED